MEKNTFVERMIREKLGLEPADHARLRALLRLPERVQSSGFEFVATQTERATGRTTNVIVDALVHLAMHPEQRIRFADDAGEFRGQGHRMTDQASRWAKDLGLDAGQIVRDGRDAKMFSDHQKP